MKRLLVLAVLSLGVWLAPLGGQQPPVQRSGSSVPGEILVKFARGVSSTRKGALMSASSATIVRRFQELELDHVRLLAGRSVEAVLTELRRNPEIVFAQPNFVYRAVAPPPPNDPHWLNDSLWGLQRIAAQETWQAFGAGNGSVIVANIDTGVMYTHPDLAANMWQNQGEIAGNSIDDDLNGYVDDVFGIDTVNHDSDPMDDHGHGTHTSGTIAAVGNNGIGVVGVNWNAKILACKFLNSAGTGSDAGAVECFNYITALKNRGENIRVSNNSWGDYRSSSISQALKDAMDAAGNAGIVNVCAAGNNNVNTDVTPFDPASFASPSVVSVAASDESDSRASFSNYGVSTVHLAGPGVGIRSTILDGNYGDASGTSMATPHVAGVAALLASIDPTLSVDNLKVLLMQNVDVLPQWAGVVASGGRLNAFRAASATGAAPPGRTNVALATNGATALASSTYAGCCGASDAINGEHRGHPWTAGGGWNDGTANAWPDWLEIRFNGAQTLDEIDVFTLQDNYAAPAEPTPTMTFSLYGLRDFEVQYWTGAAWLPVPGGAVANNTLIWRQFTFAPLTTTKIRIWVTAGANSYSRITEVEAYGTGGPGNSPPTISLTAPNSGASSPAGTPIDLAATAGDPDGNVTSVAFYANGTLLGTDPTSPYTWTWPNVPAGTYDLTAVATDNAGATTTSNSVTVTVTPPPPPPGRTNVALATNGATALASSTYAGCCGASDAINGHRGHPWTAGGGWNDGTANAWPDWLEIRFNGAQTLDEIDVFTLQDNYAAPAEPTPTMTFSLYGLRDFEVQYWTGAAWLPVPGGAVANNTLIWRQFTFAPLTTTKIRIWVTAGANSYSRITEVEAYGTGGPGNSPPTISLTAPNSGASSPAGTPIDLAATAGDPDGSVTSVAFYANGTLLGTDPTSPYTWTWPNVPAGTYDLTAVATDNAGATTTSNSVTVTVTPPPPPPGRTNVALATNGATALASSTYAGCCGASDAINGEHRGHPWTAGGGWNDGTANAWPDWLEIRFNGAQTLDEIDVFTLQDNYAAPAEPTPTMTFSLYGLRDFEVQYWTGAAWLPVPGGAVANNTLIWRQFTFAPLTTTKIRIWVTAGANSYSRITEVEAYGTGGPGNSPPTISLTAPNSGASSPAGTPIDLAATAGDPDGSVTSVAFYANGTLLGTDPTSPYTWTWPNVPAGTYDLTAVATDNAGATTTSNSVTVTVTPPPPPPGRTNVALATNGATALASSTYAGCCGASDAINGEHRGHPWTAGGGWNDGTANAWPDWLEIRFNGAQTLDEIDVFTLQDNYAAPAEPTPTMTFSLYGLRDFEVQYWTGAAWLPVPGGAVANNTLIWRQFTFAPLTTTKIRIWVTAGANSYSRITEVEAYSTGGPGNSLPTVSLTAPSSGASYPAGTPIDLAATAGDPDGNVTSVAFYANGTLLGTDPTSPYTWTWPNVPAGTYDLTAVATDNAGATTTSNSVTLTITPGTPMNPPTIAPSTITVRADFVGTMGAGSNPGSPVAAGPHLLLLKQLGWLYRWDGATAQEILARASAPAEIVPVGDEAILNVAANAAGTSLFVMFTSSVAPAAIPTYSSPRPANGWQVLYQYDFNGNALSSPQAIAAFQVNMYGHTGGGMVVLDDGTVLFATGDNGDSGEDGREFAQDPANHLSKILRIDPATSTVTVLAVGVRNVQRLVLNPNSGDPRLEFADLGGAIAEEFNSVRLADLLVGPVENFGWGRNAGDNLAREGTFYVDAGGAATGPAPTPEVGFVQPTAQFGREGAQLVAITGTVTSAASFTNITALFGDLPSGNVLAVLGAPGTPAQTVYRVNLVDSALSPVTLTGLAGGRPDPRFFLFPDGTAGVLLERTGAFYRLTQISQ